MRFEIEPPHGVGPILFGMFRPDVAEIMSRIGGGAPKKKGRTTDCYFGNAFRPSFNDQGLVEFIGVSSNPAHEFMFKGIDVFDVAADELMEHIRQFDQPDPELSKQGNEYFFPQLILSLWEADEQYDHKGGQERPMFGEVGVGTPGHLEAIRAIKRRAEG